MGLTFPGVEHLQDKIAAKAFQSQLIFIEFSSTNCFNKHILHLEKRGQIYN